MGNNLIKRGISGFMYKIGMMIVEPDQCATIKKGTYILGRGMEFRSAYGMVQHKKFCHCQMEALQACV